MKQFLLLIVLGALYALAIAIDNGKFDHLIEKPLDKAANSF